MSQRRSSDTSSSQRYTSGSHANVDDDRSPPLHDLLTWWHTFRDKHLEEAYVDFSQAGYIGLVGLTVLASSLPQFAQKRGARETVTCVHCRAPWQDPEALAGLTAAVASSAASGGVPSSYSAALAAALGAGQSSAAAVTVNREGYLNFGQVPGLGLSPSRDTSTYYSGPRRGQANRSWGGDS